MASSPLRSKSHFHTRSVSLPSRFQALTPQFDDHFRSSETTSPSLSSIGDRLNCLQHLYNCVQQPSSVEEALDRHLKLLDVCSATKDAFSQTKQDVKDLLSVMRRRKDVNDFSGYLTSRKKTKKVILKSLKSIKSTKCENNEVEASTLAVLESLILYLAGSNVKPGAARFSFVSKLVSRKDEEKETSENEFEKIDAALKTSKCSETLQSQLGSMVSSIEDIEESLDCLFRCLIKTRVSLLNILNL